MSTNLYTLDWHDTPASWDLDYGRIAHLPESADGDSYIILTAKLQDGVTAELSVTTDHGGHYADSAKTADWPVLDKMFGRDQWQAFLAEYAAQIEADLDDEDE